MPLIFRMNRIPVVLLLLITLGVQAQSQLDYDVRQDWQVYEDGWHRYSNQTTRLVHFVLGEKARGGKLIIHDRKEFAVFLDAKLIARKQDSLSLNLDSLFARYPGRGMFSIYQRNPIYSLRATLIKPSIQGREDLNPLRPGHYFSDFVILASFLIMVFLVTLFRINPRLTWDYLNVGKLFSIQERDETIVAGRIGSSVNLLFFGLISFLLGLLVMIIFNAAHDYLRWAGEFRYHNTVQAFLVWLLISTIIFLSLMTKLALIASFSWLFNLRDTVRFQFFNFIRLLFIVCILLCFLAILYFILQTQNPYPYYFLFLLASIFVGIGTVLLFLKLLARTQLPVFHLFSYLCATEIIPLLILGNSILL